MNLRIKTDQMYWVFVLFCSAKLFSNEVGIYSY